MAMDDFRMFVALEHELEGGPAEKRETLVVIALPVKHAAVKKIVAGMRFDEEAFTSVDEAEIGAAVDRVMVPRHPKILEREPQIVNLVVAQAIVLGEDDLDGMAPDFQLAAQAKNDIPQPADLRDGSALRR